MRIKHFYFSLFGSLAAALSLLAMLPVNSHAQGKIIVGNDDDTLSDPGYANASSTGTFALNVASFFGAMSGSNLLAYSNNLGLTGNSLAATMTGAGYNWTVSTSATWTLANLENYKAIFLGGVAVPSTSILTQYVQAGGDVYLFGGTAEIGDGSATSEAAAWNPFLNTFGLTMDGAYNNLIGDIPVSATASDPLFTGVSSLYFYRSSDVDLIGAATSTTYVDYTNTGNNLQAVYNGSAASAAAAPEPSTLLMITAGIALIGPGRLLGKRRMARRFS